MPYQVKLDFTPAGYALESATPGERADVAVREFTSSEDGELFISRLEGFPSDILGRRRCEVGGPGPRCFSSICRCLSVPWTGSSKGTTSVRLPSSTHE